ncbi:unnamed protein product [Didymodactylos carnosus]|uniref:RRM domain-containing protein n=1 Tax=Didymodactylos carnosus TaxID=1234261 RepID=A0A8S2LE66_9BILA|nr:unnamed protein product [Didymodactylos carnosus]CAF3901288.1 unnamed protein product [Didymodactylos carnosus]
MATSKKKEKKKQPVPLNVFLANNAENNSVPKLVTVKKETWSDIVDQGEADVEIVDISRLPTAPRGSTEVDLSEVPKDPPFTVHVGNLSFEIGDDSLKKIFGDLQPKSARVIKEGNRSRGSGFVEFETRDALIEALKRNDKEYFSRKIRVSLSEKNDQADGRGGFPRARTEEPRNDDRNRDDDRRPQERSSGGWGRDDNRQRDNHGDRHGYSSYQRKDNDRRDDRRDDRPPLDRPKYAGRHSDSRVLVDRRPSGDDPEREIPKERPKLNLQPRTKPLQESENLSASASSINASGLNTTNATDDTNLTSSPGDIVQEHESEESRQEEQESAAEHVNTNEQHQTSSASRGASIFGAAKPVDTTAKELEIERKLKETQLTSAAERDPDETKIRPRYRGNQSLHSDDYRDRHGGTDNKYLNQFFLYSQKSRGDYDRQSQREWSGGRQYENNNRRQTSDYDRNRDGGDRERTNNQREDRDRDQPSHGGGNYSSREDRGSDRGGDRSSYNNRSQYNNNDRNQYRDNNNRNDRDRGYNNNERNNYSRNDDRRKEGGAEDRNWNVARQAGPSRETYGNETSARYSDEHSRHPQSSSGELSRNRGASNNNSSAGGSDSSGHPRFSKPRQMTAADAETNRLQLSNKFGLLDEDADAAPISDEDDDNDTNEHQRNVLSMTH